MDHCLVVYRGPLQRSRLTLILNSYCGKFKKVDFIWLLPLNKYYVEELFHGFLNPFNLNAIEVIPASINSYSSAVYKLHQKLDSDLYNRLVVVGTTAVFFLPFKKKISSDLFINGIPEERLLHDSSLIKRIQVFLVWRMFGLFGEFQKVVAVSDNMAALLKNKIKSEAYYAIPSGVYHKEKIEILKKERKLVYSGSGAPWQWLSRLSIIWRKIHELDPTVKFLVVSRDKRCDILGEGILSSHIEFFEAHSGEEVFNLLQTGMLGFLIRDQNLVNQVSFPIKFGEYLAAGLDVVVSDFDWACANFIRENGSGLLIDNNAIEKSVTEIIKYYQNLNQMSVEKAVFLSQSKLSYDASLLKLGTII